MKKSFLYTQNDQAERFSSDLIKNIIQASIDSVDPFRLVSGSIVLSNRNLCIGKTTYSGIRKLIVIAIGKASLAMTRGVMEKIGPLVSEGVCVTKVLPPDSPAWKQLVIVQGGHPLPNEGSLLAGRKISDILQGLTQEDLVLVLVSGGASALVSSPYEPITLAELQATNLALLKSGAIINEVNAVRKHLESLKGGGLLRQAQPARVHALILSDVIGNDLSVIASGPTVADDSTFEEAWKVVERYDLAASLPEVVMTHLRKGVSHECAETIKPADVAGLNVINEILASNRHAIDAVLREMTERGFDCFCLTDSLKGEARQTCEWFLSEGFKSLGSMQKPALIVGGGETTVTVTGSGLGGRNLEFALAAVKHMAGQSKTLFFTLATDGEDGPTDAAGASVTSGTIKKAQALNLNPEDYLSSNDAYHFFEKVRGLIKIGSTGTNVNDLVFLIAF